MDVSKVISEAEAELRALKDRTAKLEAFIDSARALSNAEGKVVTASARVSGRGRVAARASVANPTRDAVSAILREAGRPVETRDLLPMVQERGVDVGGKDPIATLSARLSNSDEFTVKRGIGWWFSGEPWPHVSRTGTMFDEAEDTAVEGHESSASNTNQGGREDAAALVTDPFD